MVVKATDSVLETVDAVYQSESRRVLATLIRLLGDFDVAEEAMHEAFRAALEQWPKDGVPASPRAWLVSAGRFKAIDGLRRQKRFDSLEIETFAEEGTDCCYARQDKFWFQDPDGNSWEVFFVHEQLPVTGAEPPHQVKKVDKGKKASACGPGNGCC